MNRTTLKYELDLDFVLVAITTPLKDYKLCYQINKRLSVNFCRIAELELIFNGDEKPLIFSRYSYEDSQTETVFYVLANKGADGLLIPEMRNVDFFLLIKNYIDKDDLQYLITGINKISEVLVAVEIEPKKLKSKENLIF
ncbi:MAG: hypothetical protein JWN56_2725 [Sphingobacteriales bacterium]|nr:hypothetical protein [Sphingobacteriales bacterium]